jgi:DNA-binding transcriptional LysR family regulator
MPDVNYELYKVFYEAAENKSISKAAEKLYVSQSAVSQAVMQLEQKLGGKLFDRGARGVTLTPEGEVLYSYIKNAVSTIENAQEKLQNMRTLNEGEIKIGASDTICNLFLLPVLKRFNEAHPGIHIAVTNRVTNDSIMLLKNGAVDISFINLPIENDPMLETVPVMQVHDCFAAGERYAFLRGKTLDYAELANYPVLMLEPNSNTRKRMDIFLAANGAAVHPAIELGSLSMLAEFAKIGLGVAATIREDVEGMMRGGELFELKFGKEPPVRHIGLARLKNVTLSFAAGKFIDELTI